MKTIQSYTGQAPNDIVTGTVYTTTIISGEEAPQVRVGRMQFAPGARTAWHSHIAGEYLHILEGTALVQERNGEIAEFKAGDTVYTAPDVEHWHGADESSFMTHLAIWGARDHLSEGPDTKWGSKVSDDEAQSSGQHKDEEDDQDDNEDQGEEESKESSESEERQSKQRRR